MAARRAAAQVRDPQVAGVHEPDELRRLVVQERVRPDRVARGAPGVGKPGPDVGLLQVVGPRVAAVAIDAAEPDASPACSAGRAVPGGTKGILRSWPRPPRRSAGRGRAPRSSSGTGNGSAPASRRTAASRGGGRAGDWAMRHLPIVAARRPEQDARHDQDRQRQSVAGSRGAATCRDRVRAMGGQPPCRRDTRSADGAPESDRRRPDDSSDAHEPSRSTTQNVNTTLMNPATRAPTRPLKLS